MADCSIKTLDTDDVVDFSFPNELICNKISMKADCLRDAFLELDLTSEFIEISMSPSEPHLRLCTRGATGSWNVRRALRRCAPLLRH